MSVPGDFIEAETKHQVAYADLTALLGKHAHEVSGMELLAIAANMLGKLAALQDQRQYSYEQVMATIKHNIELGNREAITKLFDGQYPGETTTKMQ